MERAAEMIDAISCGDRTLLLVDQTEGEQTHNMFLTSAKYVVLDAEKISMKMTVKRQSVASILEECRFQLTFAMKYGKTLVVRFGYHMTDFKFTFCDEHCPGLEPYQKHNHLQKARYLPRGFMMDSGAGLREEAMVRALYNREDIVELIQDAEEDEEDEIADIAHYVPVCHPDFKVVMTTTMPYDKLDDFHFHRKYGLPAPREMFDIRRFTLQQTLLEGEDA